MQMTCIYILLMLRYYRMEKLLRKHHLKVTPSRIDIFDLLSHGDTPKTAETIYKSLKKKHDLATIYRNLENFEKKGLIFKETAEKKDYYYLAESPHHHIVCRNCKKMECVPCSHQRFEAKNFTEIKHQLLLTGLCRQCS